MTVTELQRNKKTQKNTTMRPSVGDGTLNFWSENDPPDHVEFGRGPFGNG